MTRNRCAECGGKFGLVSYFWYSKRFCRKNCRYLYRKNYYSSLVSLFSFIEHKVLHLRP